MSPERLLEWAEVVRVASGQASVITRPPPRHVFRKTTAGRKACLEQAAKTLNRPPLV
jgi:hypothetical protein